MICDGPRRARGEHIESRFEKVELKMLEQRAVSVAITLKNRR